MNPVEHDDRIVQVSNALMESVRNSISAWVDSEKARLLLRDKLIKTSAVAAAASDLILAMKAGAPPTKIQELEAAYSAAMLALRE
jgi:hypothetical protein